MRLFWLVVTCIMLTGPARADLVGAIAVGLTGKQLLEQSEKIIQGAIRSAQNAGDALITKAATEANVLAKSVEVSLANQLDNAIRDIEDKAVRAPLLRLAELTDEVSRAERRFYRMRDASIIDLHEIANSAPFVDSPIFIQRLEGLAYLQGSGEVHVAVTALGLRPTARRTASVRIIVDGKELQPIRVETGAADKQNPGGAHTRTLVFSSATLAGQFLSGQVAIVPANLELTVITKRIIGSRSQNIKVPIYLSLIPRNIGSLTVKSRATEYGWMRQEQEISSRPTPSSDCGENKCRERFAIDIPVVGGNQATPAVGHQRIVSARWTCKPLWGPRSCAYPGGWFTPTIDIASDKSRATLTIEHWAERNEYQLFVVIEQYMETGDVDHSEVIPVVVGEPFAFRLPPNTTQYQVAGRLVNNMEINFVRGQSSDVLIKGVELDEAKGAKRVVYQISQEALGL